MKVRKKMAKFKKTLIPISGVVYGEIIYWCTIFSSVVVLIGMVRALLEEEGKTSPEKIFAKVLSGEKIQLSFDGMHNNSNILNDFSFINLFSTNEQLTTAGLAFGVFSVVPATFFCAFFLWRSHNSLFSILAMLAGLLTIGSMTGIIFPNN